MLFVCRDIMGPMEQLNAGETINKPPNPFLMRHAKYGPKTRERAEELHGALEALKPRNQELIEERRKKKLQERAHTSGDMTLLQYVEDLKPADYDPLLIAKGGEHLVFEMPSRKLPEKMRDVVVKVNFHKAKELLSEYWRASQAKNDKEAAQIREEAEIRLRHEAEEFDERQKQLRAYFGANAVPRIKVFIEPVPIDKNVLNALRPPAPEVAPGEESVTEVRPDFSEWPNKEIPKEIPGWISVQKRLELNPDNMVSLNGYYAENLHADLFKDTPERQAERYDHAHRVLTQPARPDVSAEEQDNDLEAVLAMYPDLVDVDIKCRDDAAFKAKLADTAKRLVRYTNEVGVALDLAGSDNIILVKGEKGWELKMPDALPPGDFRMQNLKDAVESFVHDGGPPAFNAAYVLNELNTVRVVNALALISGVSDRVIIPDIEKIPSESIREYLSKFVYGKSILQDTEAPPAMNVAAADSATVAKGRARPKKSIDREAQTNA